MNSTQGVIGDHEPLPAEAGAVGVIGLDVRGYIQHADAVAASLLGWPQHWLIGRSLKRWVFSEDRHAFMQHLIAACNRSPSTLVLRLRDRQGRQLEVNFESCSPAVADSTAPILTQVRDVTQRRRAERRNCLLRAEQAHQVRLQSLGEFSASLVHELSQPLGTIRLLCESGITLSQGSRSTSEGFGQILANALKAIGRAEAIVARMRDLSRRDDAERILISPESLARESIHLIEPLARESDCDIQLVISQALPLIAVDRLRMEQVFLNLLQNSIEAMAAADTPLRRVAVTISHADMETVRFAIIDNGPGLRPDRCEAIFAPFFTTKPKGLGLGLCISRTIIQAHQGQLWAVPSERAGAEFRIDLPRAVA